MSEPGQELIEAVKESVRIVRPGETLVIRIDRSVTDEEANQLEGQIGYLVNEHELKFDVMIIRADQIEIRKPGEEMLADGAQPGTGELPEEDRQDLW